jgi:hypothetical protein
MPKALLGVAKKTRHDRPRFAAYIETVARMSHWVAFRIDFFASGATAAKTVCHRYAGWRRSADGGGTTIVARVFVVGG